MGRNVEIKARARDFAHQARIAADVGGGNPQRLVQEDTFFDVPTGRLKLRDFGDGSGELIQYDRDDASGPTESRYQVVLTSDPKALRGALAGALGVRDVVRKTRTVHLAGQTRIHLDKVEGLGEFIELEVVLAAGESVDHGISVANELMERLGIAKSDLVESAYVDLLEERASDPR